MPSSNVIVSQHVFACSRLRWLVAFEALLFAAGLCLGG